ncbi:hypothetical protein CKO25_04715 [Thiocapsa imhoffii]|uniref:DUF433 domain-containing protein n=1 Tax=Thiocapsa imhoffii TaxID=382777 RepID=A0A9X1B8H5_9GAMM|nr:DUF433 domain-containing protein [Thiocapsa imhoffii]MBK1643971.1 hypothetical protein [Thiocapsa imhoffii]
MTVLDSSSLIASDPEIRDGKPCFVGTRICVHDLLEYLAGGMTEGALLADFPSLQPRHVRAALAYAAQRASASSDPRPR